MQQNPDTLINEISNLLEEIIPVLDRNIQMLQNDINPQGGALQYLLQQEIENQVELLKRTRELQESVEGHLKPEPSIRLARRRFNGDINVIMEDGQEICHSRASETFAEVIEKIGLERVKNLDLTLNGIPLIATYKHPTYSQTKSGTYYIATHCSTTTKIERLNEIKHRLILSIEVLDNRER